MNSLKMGAAAVGALLTLLAASKDAQASVIAPNDAVATLHGDADSAAFWADDARPIMIDGPGTPAQHDGANAWSFTLRGTNGDSVIKGTAFYDALKSENWILSATSDYFRETTHMATIPRAQSFFSTVTQDALK